MTPDRPSDFIDYDDDEPLPPAAPQGIDFDEDEDDLLPHHPVADAPTSEALPYGPPGPPEEDDEDDGAGVLREGIGRAAAVLKYMVEHIVDEPGEISIGATTDDRGPVLLLRVADDDRGKVIGRQGRIVQALRTIVKAASVGSGEKIGVEILD
ncbi:MAG: KH domain-containing protein [Candidatus Eremiobacteraeota bacterium]|nr:KH domain-containing protein [Candidatus Eremiobacteraeota bacterium]MBC5826959.1 KH domain-containing protein [Candidatus Eremiobacteraeota bacterium]